MRSALLTLTLPVTLLALVGSASARDIVIPAGTLMQCTLSEPNFSSATASVGDPVLCHPRTVQQFGQPAFPRGTYLVGHLEADKDPGHFVGKGYLKLEFDRIGLPNTDIPLPGKIIATKGYKVDKDGKIIGHGHPTRDAVEWMIPPLWPWKIITLPARGPRPALKGETLITMRIMDDVVIPQNALSEWHRFGMPSQDAYDQPSAYHPSRNAQPPVLDSAPALHTASEQVDQNLNQETPTPVQDQDLTAAPAAPSTSLAVFKTTSSDADASQPPLTWHYYGQRTSAASPAPTPNADARAPKLTLFALNSGAVYAVADYWVQNGSLQYVLANGDQGAAALRDIDWSSTTQLNSERNVRVTLRSGAQTN
ncbi:MAG TPA: hypothetical protein VLW84_06025 [Terriglobales bacterium]|nr:hypothetical protein [Terriglobales bacterium]